MALFDEDLPRKRADLTIGEDLSRLSLDELEERISVLKAEISRVEQAIGEKRLSHGAAESFFRRSG